MDNESLSSAFGWVSIACWIVVFSPQIVENYRLQSGEGLSVAFVLIWIAGDLCNFFGAVMAHLQITVIVLGIYYTLCDLTLLAQIYYYRWKRNRILGSPGVDRHARPMSPSSPIPPPPPPPQVILQRENGEQSPLLGPHRRLSSSSSSSPYLIPFPRLSDTDDETRRPEKEEREEGMGRATLRYAAALLFVIGVGLAAWVVGHQSQSERDHGHGGAGDGGGSGERSENEKDVIEWRSQVIGWSSAILYLGSRIPQILKNFKTRCEGLSLALFMFTIVGNVTYVLSICTESMEPRHLVANASWLAGSGLTVFLDVFVLCQFFYFHRVDGCGYEVISNRE